MNEHVREVLTKRIEYLDSEIEWADESIATSAKELEHDRADRDNLVDERVSLAKFLGVVF